MYDAVFNIATVMFDKPIVDQPLAAANWQALGNVPTSAVANPPDFVQVFFAVSLETPFDLEYLATPPDVEGAPPNGLDVEPFTIPVV